jgi:hypothetical protein
MQLSSPDRVVPRMEASAAPRVGWTFAQKGIVVLAAIQLVWALAGFVAEPNFSLGENAPTERVLGIDFNGYHALAGLLLFAPAFYFALDPWWAVFYALYADRQRDLGDLRHPAGLGLHLPQQPLRRDLPPRFRSAVRNRRRHATRPRPRRLTRSAFPTRGGQNALLGVERR